MLELVLSRDQQSKNFQVDPRLVAAHLRNGLFPVFAEIAQERANDLLAQLVTRAPQSSGRVANPGGSLEATRRSFNKDFLLALAADFKKHGAAAIEKVRKTQPAAYMKICALLVPR